MNSYHIIVIIIIIIIVKISVYCSLPREVLVTL